MGSRSNDRRPRAVALGSRLRQLREGLGLVLQDVADLFQASRNVPSQWEGGQREPSYDILLVLADYYGVTTDWLLGREGAEQESPRVRHLKSQLRDYLRLQQATLPGKTPGERLKLAVDFLSAREPGIFRLERLARQLLIPPEVLQAMLAAETIATPVVIQCFAQHVNLPELWFYKPSPELEDPLLKYRAVVERFHAAGLTPEMVEARAWAPRRVARRPRKPGID